MSTPNSAVLVDWFERLALLLAWAFVIIVFGAVRPNTFLTWGNFSAILGSQAVLVVVALGLTLSLTAGDYDLSIASVLSLAGTVLAVLNARNGVPIGWAIAAALAVGAAVGFINGFFVIFFRINSMIVTLGIGTFVHGVTLWLGDQETISGISSGLVEAVIVRRLFGVPLSFYYAFALCVLIWYVFSYTVLGRRLLFVGRGREIARLSGIRVDRLRWGCFIVSGLMGAIAGILYVGTVAAADPNSGLSFLLPACAAAFLGATSINPGRFNPWGTMISVYFLVTGITGLSILGVSTFIQDLFYGGALVVSVTLSQIVRGREERLT
ncbi:MAG TPA: ABC transporter permease [Xanthobacteraceae bacterium]|nr:ABC transporter permease [Xanthobacteraceae bacterium]